MFTTPVGQGQEYGLVPVVNFFRAMLCKRGLCRHALSVCVSVRPSVRHVREFCQ